jgi:drug/metabolite transporter (DMT)-like permease
VLLGESPSALQLLGVVGILGGLTTVALGRRRAAAAAA